MIGGSNAGPSLSAGDIQLMHIGLSSLVRANTAGADLVAVGSLSNVIRGTLFAAPGVTDLNGGVFGISSAGSESDAVATLVLERLGLARADVTVKEFGLGRLAALLDGEVTAAMLDEPQRSEALAAGLAPIIDFLTERVPWLYTSLAVTRPYLETWTATGSQSPTRRAARLCWPMRWSLAMPRPSTSATTILKPSPRKIAR
jgi:ABC-type nitrate/sulfonate/bicarbonate transport system substrate-binding protein